MHLRVLHMRQLPVNPTYTCSQFSRTWGSCFHNTVRRETRQLPKVFWTLKVHVHPLRVYTCRFTKAWGESASDNKEVCVLPLKLPIPNLKKSSSWDDAIWRIPLSFGDVSVFRRGGVPADSPRVDPVPGRAASGEGSYFGAVHILWTPHGWCKYGEIPRKSCDYKLSMARGWTRVLMARRREPCPVFDPWGFYVSIKILPAMENDGDITDKNGVLATKSGQNVWRPICTDEHHLPRPPILTRKPGCQGCDRKGGVWRNSRFWDPRLFADWLWLANVARYWTSISRVSRVSISQSFLVDLQHSPCSSSWRAQRTQLASQARRCGGQLLSAAEAVWVAQLAQLPERTQLRSYAVFQVNNESRWK